MYPVGVVETLGLILFFWLLGLSYIVFKERGFLHRLFPKSQERDIRNKFQEVLDAIEEFKVRDQVLSRNFRELNKEGLSHIQKIEILRYNPYGDTGGDQSFSIAVLDGKLNGVLLTSLHSRASTRLYAKIIKAGKSELELSKEEKQVLAQAVNIEKLH
ncbi:DUF4446 family protein [Candidatus Daviesbacteria bacterium]|nr:DUF4446 family protein [Candidatus Daviesbacteria bacterium]